MIFRVATALFVLGAISVGHTALAQEKRWVLKGSTDVTPSYFAKASIGYSWIEGSELVFDQAGNKISDLGWRSEAPVLNVAVGGETPLGLRATIHAKVGLGGDSIMKDFDWLEPYAPSFARQDWSDVSVHDETDLVKYVDAGINLSKDVYNTKAASLSLEAGFKYTNVKWKAKGGEFVYSEFGFRDSTGNFPFGEVGISYEQWFPTSYLGLSGEVKFAKWTLGGTIRGGAALGSGDQDYHFDRDLRFDQTYDTVPFAGISANVSREITPRTKLFASAEFEQYFKTVGDATISSISTGQVFQRDTDGVGVALRTLSLNLGAVVSF